MDAELRGANGVLPDSFMAMPGWSKGVAFLNGINLVCPPAMSVSVSVSVCVSLCLCVCVSVSVSVQDIKGSL